MGGGGSLKDVTFKGEILKNQCIGGDWLKREGAWKVCGFKGRLNKKERGAFEGGRG